MDRGFPLTPPQALWYLFSGFSGFSYRGHLVPLGGIEGESRVNRERARHCNRGRTPLRCHWVRVEKNTREGAVSRTNRKPGDLPDGQRDEKKLFHFFEEREMGGCLQACLLKPSTCLMPYPQVPSMFSISFGDRLLWEKIADA